MEKVIKKYLDEKASQDQAFAEKYANEKKSISQCVEYIKSEARKKIKGSAGHIDDDVVFGWALHYYDEENIKFEAVKGGSSSSRVAAAPQVELTEEDKAKAKALAMERLIEKQMAEISKKPAKKKAVEVEQPSLF